MAHPKVRAAVLFASVDDVEAQFYEALQQGDLERLMAVWSDDDEVVCVHPGGPRVVGHGAIRAAFEAAFAQGSIPVQPDKVRHVEAGDCAVHSVMERVEIAGDDGAQTGWVIATNVYFKTARGWRLVAHHASPGAMNEVPEVTEAPTTLH